MTIWDHLCCLWYGIQARYSAFDHLMRGHEVKWRTNIELWVGCTGDIECIKCPDTENNNDLVIWIRRWGWMGWVATKICGLLGHPGFQHPKKWNGQGDPGDEANMVDVLEEECCTRCAYWGKVK